jgi:hypothetical protein
MTIKTCASCRFAQPHGDPGQRVCKRFPPTPYIMGADQLGRPMQLNVFPAVGMNDTCGEWTERFGIPSFEIRQTGEATPLEGRLGPGNDTARDG